MKLTIVLTSGILISALTACGGADNGAAQANSAPQASSHITAITNLPSSNSSPLVAALTPNQQALAAAQTQWQAADAQNYHFKYKEGSGYKFAAYPYKTIQVVAGKVVAVDGDTTAAQEPVYQRLTVEGLFAEIQNTYIQDATSGTERHSGASYDTLLGFPTAINSGNGVCCDQDHELAIIDFQLTL